MENLKIKVTKIEHNFWTYLMYKLPFNKNKKYNFQLYENFQINILSEEYFMRNHLNIYNLLKLIEKKRIFQQRSYKLYKLISLM